MQDASTGNWHAMVGGATVGGGLSGDVTLKQAPRVSPQLAAKNKRIPSF